MTSMRPRLFVHVASLVALLLLGGGVATALARSEKAEPQANSRIESLVTRSSSLCTQENAPKNGRVTRLAQGKNAFLARLEMDPFAKVPEHRDATEEYIHVLSGHGTMWIDDEQTVVGPGDTVFMPANAKVRFENGPSSMSAIQVFAGPGPAEKYTAWSGCGSGAPEAGRRTP
jgi:quercetin dioxygenase-like cupin family protein